MFTQFYGMKNGDEPSIRFEEVIKELVEGAMMDGCPANTKVRAMSIHSIWFASIRNGQAYIEI